MEQPDSGAVEIHGSDATRVPPQRRGIGFVFQHYAAFKHMTVRDNVAFGLTIRKQPKAEIRARVDEPFGALDAKVRTELRRLHDEVHVTTVLVTHDQEEAMASPTTRGHGPGADRAGGRPARALRPARQPLRDELPGDR